MLGKTLRRQIEGVIGRGLRVACCLVILGAAAPLGAGAQDTSAAVVRALTAAARHPWARWPDFAAYSDDVARLYAARADALVWHQGTELSSAGRAAVRELLAAGDQGLDPRDYDAGTLDSLSRRSTVAPLAPADRARFDLLLSVDVIRYVDDLRTGRTHPQLQSRGAVIPPLDRAAAVSAAVAADSIPALARAMEPQLVQYRNLKRLLVRYRRLAADPSLAGVPGGPAVQPGGTYGGLPALARLLVALGDLAPDSAAVDSTGRYAGAIVGAVRRFQLRHDLDPDGVLNPATIAALNTPLAWRVRQIELALERLRWLPPLGGQRVIAVNTPAFRLFAFDSAGVIGEPALEMKVIVGRAVDRRTPMLFEQLRYVEFRPYWNVPRSILVREIIPQLERRPDYLRANDMEVVGPRDSVLGADVTPETVARLAAGELRVRQRPGPANALGLIKFVFPNAADVYMHGTPATELFARTRRDFSHGCIRVEDPVALAAWVLRDLPRWPRDSILAAMNGTRSLRAAVSRPLPVAVFYTTAVVRPDGTAWFSSDIYGLDGALDEALRAGATPP